MRETEWRNHSGCRRCWGFERKSAGMLLLTSTDTLGLSRSLVSLGGWGQGFGPGGAWAKWLRVLLRLLSELRRALLRLLLRLG